MDNISKALESVQEELLTLYETNSQRLQDQIRHWFLNKREQELLYLARKYGISRVGMTTVPPQSVSQQRAKTAIEQHLLLSSLCQSKFGQEPWTLSDTSRERLLAPPSYCFKKEGEHIEVRFDGKDENTASYVHWKSIYYQTDSDDWEKARGQVNERGLFYVDSEGFTNYYVDFLEEAKRYSTTGVYEVLYKLTPNAVPTSTSIGPGDSATPSVATSYTPKKNPTPRNRRRLPRRSSPRRPHQRSLRSGFGGGEGEFPPASRTGITAPSPGEVGKNTSTTSGRNRSRVDRLLLDAKDPPVLVLKGDANCLKCTRYRLKLKYPQFFSGISTTWQWTARDGTQRCGRSRMLLSFLDTEQRERFVNTVPLPKSVQWFRGSFDDL